MIVFFVFFLRAHTTQPSQSVVEALMSKVSPQGVVFFYLSNHALKRDRMEAGKDLGML